MIKTPANSLKTTIEAAIALLKDLCASKLTTDPG